MITFHITCSARQHDSPHHIATLSFLWGEWSLEPRWCDWATARRPRDGYRLRCRSCGAYASVEKAGLQAALLRLHEHQQDSLSIQGIHALLRTPGAHMKRPQPLADAGGFSLERGRHGA